MQINSVIKAHFFKTFKYQIIIDLFHIVKLIIDCNGTPTWPNYWAVLKARIFTVHWMCSFNMFHARLEWIYTLQSPEYHRTFFSKQEPNQQPLGSYTHSQHTNQIRTHNIAQSSSQFGQKSECSFTKYKYVNSTLVTVTKMSSVTPFWLRIPLKFKELQSILHFVVGKPLKKCLCRLCLCYPVTSLTKALLQLILLSLP